MLTKIITKFRLIKYQTWLKVLLLSVAFIIQVYITSWPDTSWDVKWYRSWCRTIVNEGIASAYWDNQQLKEEIQLFPKGINIDYPPIYPYILYGIGTFYKHLNPISFETNNDLLDLLIKLPATLANILISLLIFIELRKKINSNVAFFVAVAYAVNPAILFATSYWGQTDSIISLFVLLSIVLLVNKKPEWSWVSITLGVFTKPLAYPFVPIIAIFTLKRFGIKHTLRCALTSLVTTFVIFLPFIYINRFSDIIKSLFFQLDAMPYLSINAHNIWWIVGAGPPFVDADTEFLGLVSYRSIGIALFSIFYLISFLKFWKTDNESSLYYLSAGVALGFFMLPTHIHERHLFNFFPILSMIYFHDRRIKLIYIIATISFLANMVLHDPPIIKLLSSINTGPILAIPDERGGNISLLKLFMTLFNSQINILIFCYWIYYFYFREKKGFDVNLFKKSMKVDSLLLIKMITIVILFISFTSIPFIVKVANFAKEQYFIFNLGTAEIKPTKDQHVAIYNNKDFYIDGEIRSVLFAHPPCQITYKLTLPKEALLSFGIALSPGAWRNDKGDGVLFELMVQDGDILERVFSKYIDPKYNVSDRKWHDELIDLSRYGGKEIKLSFITQPGFVNDANFDWAVWSNPKIVTVANGNDSSPHL